MSYRALNWAWEADLPTSQKFVLVALADMADEQESCFPGQERLARMVGGSVSTVRRAVKSLESSGHISREQRRGADGMRTSDRYRLHVNRSIRPVVVTGQSVQGHRSNDAVLTGHGDGVTPREPSEEPPVLLSTVADEAEEKLDVLWGLWPSARRSTRKVVAQSLRTALKAAPWPAIHAAAVTHSHVWRSWPASDQRFVPLLSTWLNQERWTGSPPAQRASTETFARRQQENSLAIFEHYRNQEEGNHAEVRDRQAADVQALDRGW